MNRQASKLLMLILVVAMTLTFAAPYGRAAETGAGIDFKERTIFTVTYICGDEYAGPVPETTECRKGESVRVNGPLTMGGSEFSGWRYRGPSTVRNGSVPLTDDSVIAGNTSFIMPNDDVVLIAQWAQLCEVNFYLNIGGLETPYDTMFITYGASITTANMPPRPTRSGYDFIGWSLERNKGVNETALIANMIILEDIDIFAQWRRPGSTPETNTPDGNGKEEIKPTPTPSTPPTPPTQTPPTPPTQTPTPPIRTPDPQPDPNPDPPPAPPTSNPGTQPTPGPGTVDPDPGELPPEDATPDTDPEPNGDEFDINDTDVPRIMFGNRGILLFPPAGAETWALSNLIIATLGLGYAVVNIARAVLRKKRGQKEDTIKVGDNTYEVVRDVEEGIIDKALRPGWLATSIAMGVAGALIFPLTQQMGNTMVLIDLWTIAHAAILAAEIVAVLFIFKKNGTGTKTNNTSGENHNGTGLLLSK